MKTNICTTQDQSARLLKCGVPAESADMSIDTDTDKLYLGAYSERVDKAIKPVIILCFQLPFRVKTVGFNRCPLTLFVKVATNCLPSLKLVAINQID